ncbi:MAG TPA: DUF1254 domain-containing protein, partial [Myxococcaceae bacterium]|nr:DUF1254 domain-containing protein [Myxococcaceae bacterium]
MAARSVAAALVLAIALCAGCSKQQDPIALAEKKEPVRPSLEEIKAIAEEGFIYGLPIVMNYAVLYDFVIDRNSGQWKGPFNQIANEARVFTYKDTSVPTPNSDTPYSMLWLDLRAEPMVLSVPAVPAPRYYSLMLCDGNTFNYGYIGSRATGTAPGDYLVAGPDWQGEKPAGIKEVFRATTQFALTIYRTQLFDAGDMENVKKIQSGYKAQPLSAFLKQPAPPAPPAIKFPKIDKDLAKTEFFEYLDFALQFAPPGPEEKSIREKLARIGVGAGKTFEFKDLSLEHKAAVLLGMKAGNARVAEAGANIGKRINGWSVGSAFGPRAFFKGNWLLRAAAAHMGIYGNDAVEAMYPATKVEPSGEPIDTGKYSYTLTFPRGQLPPVKSFWSVTMYDGKNQILVENPLGRYLINTPMM